MILYLFRSIFLLKAFWRLNKALKKIELFIKNSASFYQDKNLKNIDKKHKEIIKAAYQQFSKELNISNIKNWLKQSDMAVPSQLSLLQFKYSGFFKSIIRFILSLTIRRDNRRFIKSTLLDDYQIIKSKKDGLKLLKENPVHLTPGSTLFYQYENTTINARWLRYIYILQQIKLNNLLQNNQIWVDVGSYYGGLAGLVKKYYPNVKIILVDFHHQLCRSYVYLSEMYQDTEHIFPDNIKEYKNFDNMPNGSIMYVPVNQIKIFQDNKVDLYTNFFAFGEMRKEVFNSYLENSLYQNAKKIYLVNRFVSSPFFETTYDTNLNIFDYNLHLNKKIYFDIFPMQHYMLIEREVFGRKEFRNISSPHFEAIFSQGNNDE